MSLRSINFFQPIRRWIKKRRRMFVFSKRQLFIGLTAFLTLGLLVTQLVEGTARYISVIGLSVGSCLFSYLVLRENLEGSKRYVILILPTLFPLAVGLFYFLLPVRWLTRLPAITLYAVGMYALLLTMNIFSIAATRTIALLRAAHTVGFVLVLITYYLFVQTILSFHFNAFITALCVGLMTFLLSMQSIWSYELTNTLSGINQLLSASISLMILELVWIFSFIPIESNLLALFYTTCFYVYTGMGQQYVSQRLYKKIAIEFLFVLILVSSVMILTVKWRNFGY